MRCLRSLTSRRWGRSRMTRSPSCSGSWWSPYTLRLYSLDPSWTYPAGRDTFAAARAPVTWLRASPRASSLSGHPRAPGSPAPCRPDLDCRDSADRFHPGTTVVHQFRDPVRVPSPAHARHDDRLVGEVVLLYEGFRVPHPGGTRRSGLPASPHPGLPYPGRRRPGTRAAPGRSPRSMWR